MTVDVLGEHIDCHKGAGEGSSPHTSTTLFKIVTFKIMNSLEVRGIEYEVEGQKITTLFFADDSLAMAKTIEAARRNLRIIEEESRKYELELNKEKKQYISV